MSHSMCRGTRKRSRKRESSCKQGSRGSQEEQEEGVEEDNDNNFGDTCDMSQFWADGIQWPVPYRAEMCKLVEDLVDELLCACRIFCKHTFKPQLQPAIGMGCVYEGWSVWEDNVLYRLPVPLQPPPGHHFCLELDTAEEVLTNASCLHVQQKRVYTREQMVGDMLCFLHHHEDDVKASSPASLTPFTPTNSCISF
ncbi:LOW QUALITY PROTEIN: inositol 1,4,5-trisphosphate receptor-interacting protein-like 1 [Strigops habroptila]|uniref:LOW QUALITY PROTEIN: inositol 1,4,5-trisphosphate receptor-interacting protein-like 1 n=1 Tax=Strigops habroptila TaxID=2489341 RepID=UPI0011CF0D70|nr:LOW QUALITY PROTEIN: inositol 1,4,5-trisphosphate receptor-interacting protein-like 1 [Strigops habroptila]